MSQKQKALYVTSGDSSSSNQSENDDESNSGSSSSSSNSESSENSQGWTERDGSSDSHSPDVSNLTFDQVNTESDDKSAGSSSSKGSASLAKGKFAKSTKPKEKPKPLKNPWAKVEQNDKTKPSTKSLIKSDSMSSSGSASEHEIIFDAKVDDAASSSSKSSSDYEEIFVEDNDEAEEEITVTRYDSDDPEVDAMLEVGSSDEENQKPKRRGIFSKMFSSKETISDEKDAEAVNDEEHVAEDGNSDDDGDDTPGKRESTRGLFGRIRRSKTKEPVKDEISQEDEPPVEDVEIGRVETSERLATSGGEEEEQDDPKVSTKVNILETASTEAEVMFHDGSTDSSPKSAGFLSRIRRRGKKSDSKTPSPISQDGSDAEFGTPVGDSVVAGEDDGKPPRPVELFPAESNGDRQAGVTSVSLCCFLFLTAVVIVLSTIGTSFYGAKLALDQMNIQQLEPSTMPPSTVTTTAPAPPTGTAIPTAAPSTSTVSPPSNPSNCPDGNVALELQIVFDSRPAEVGIRLFDGGQTSSVIWLFDTGSFRSFTQFQRNNIFQICVSPERNYDFEITDTGNDGLSSTFAGQPVFGSWKVLYNNSEIGTYDGDCNNTQVGACGPYCACQFALVGDASTGSCTTNCTLR